MYLERCDEQVIISQSPRLMLVTGAVFAAAGLCLIYYALTHLSGLTFNHPMPWASLFMGIAFCGVG